ncbi:sodium/solute symporter [bacterium]|nr:sodium/solute symporter [bacterium]
MFGAFDWGVVIIYICAMVWLGFLFSKKQTTTKAYFLGDNNMPWWAAGFSIIATETSALTVIGIPAMTYGGNLTFLQIVLGYVIARIFVTIVMIPQYFKGKVLYSPYEIIGENVGSKSKILTVYFIMIANFLAAGVRVYVTAIPLKLLLGIPIWVSIVIFGIIAIFYTYLGGISAVMWTDVIQFFMFVGGGLFAFFYIPTLIDGGFSEIYSNVSKAGKLKWFDPAFSLSGGYNIWMGVIGAAVMGALTHGADQLGIQRVLTCRSEKDGKKAMFLSAALIFPVFFLFLLIGLMLYVYYQSNPFALSPIVDGKFKADYLFPIFIISKLPIGIKGLLISSIFAAAMSSIDSALSAISSIYVMNIHKEVYKPGESEEYYINFSKKIIFIFGIVLIFVAFACQHVDLIMNWAFKLPNITGGAVLGAMFYAFRCRKTDKSKQLPIITGMIVSAIVMICIVTMTKVHWPWYACIGTSVTLIVSYTLKAILSGKKTVET